MEEASTLLPDGRTLVWAEFGEPTGAPLFLFHGWPGSRLVGSHFDEAARDLGVRIICPDRPGVGRSTHLPGRLVTDWPNDVEALAARLEVERFVAAGKSAGGPYVLACAAALRSRVSACGLLSPSGEINTRDSLVGVKQPNRLLFAWSRRSSLGRRFFVAVTGAALRRQRSPLVKGLPQELATRVRSEAMEVKGAFIGFLPITRVFAKTQSAGRRSPAQLGVLGEFRATSAVGGRLSCLEPSQSHCLNMAIIGSARWPKGRDWDRGRRARV